MSLSPFTNVFGGGRLDRAAERRGDTAWLADQLSAPKTRSIALWNGLVRVDPTGRLARLPLDPGQDAETLLFLGLDQGAAVFAVDLEGEAEPALAEPGAFVGLRDLAMTLAPDEAGMAATAKAIFEWRRRHRFCSVCGAPSRVAEAGWKRVCPVCGGEHFPRTDPVVIMLPTFGEQCLLGRNRNFRPGLFSALAGFVEPGETIEQACARELKEEAGLVCERATYHSCQPWPFPSSLMIGLLAEVASAEAQADLTELEEVRWFTRAQAAALLEGRLEGLAAPQPFAIAHQLLRTWIGGGR